MQRKTILGPDLNRVPYNMQVPPESRLLKHYNPFLGFPWRTEAKENEVPEVVRTLGAVIHFSWKDKWPEAQLYTSSWPVVWLDGQDFKETGLELVTRKSGDYRLFWMGKEDVSQVNAHQRISLAEEDLINKRIGGPFYGYLWVPFPSHPSPNRLMNQVPLVAGMHSLSTMDFYSPMLTRVTTEFLIGQ